MNATIAQLLAAVVPAITAALFANWYLHNSRTVRARVNRIAGVNQRENATRWCYCTASYSSQFCKLTDAKLCFSGRRIKLFFFKYACNSRTVAARAEIFGAFP